MREIIAERAQRVLSERKEYSIFGTVPVYVLHSLPQEVDLVKAIADIEEIVPHHLSREIESIFIGEFPELISREVKAVYKDSSIYVTNEQDSVEELVDDIVHEVAHAVESYMGMEIYSDGYLEREFIEKRKKMLDILSMSGYNVNVVQFLDTEYSKELDYFFYKGVGYDSLNMLSVDVFPTAYSMTSLREYFAVGFEEYLYGDREELKRVSPVLYSKVESVLSY